MYTNLVVSLVPITDKKCKFSIRCRIWDWYDGPLCNIETPKTPSSFMQLSWREVGEGSNLILGLKLVCPVCVWRDGAIGSKHSILPWWFSLVYSIPGLIPTNKKRKITYKYPNNIVSFWYFPFFYPFFLGHK